MEKMKRRGFTLLEALAVIAIIGIISTIVVVMLNSTRAKMRDAKRLADVRQIQTALELYFDDKQQYPDGATVAVALGGANASALCTGGFVAAPCPAGATTYMGTVPSAAVPPDGLCSSGTNAFVYTTPTATAAVSYDLAFCLGGSTDGVPGGVHNAMPSGIR
jgi:prepilin-type N-terminal cleavage/methylation domain-containing protein